MLLAKIHQCPFTHDLDALMEKLEEAGVEIPEPVDASGILTRYAVETRYPHLQGPVTRPQFCLAQGVLDWARQNI